MADAVYRRPAVEKMTALSRSSIYDMMKRDEFPRPIKITGKAVAWRESDISAWLASRPQPTY